MIPILGALFFASGACALLYQTVWVRLLSLVFGVTVHAASAVLASFMTGLAVGSFVAGRRAPRLLRPLAVLGVVEILIGICALATPLALDAVRAAYLGLHPHLEQNQAVLLTVRVGLAFLLLVVPTSLMGSTLPIAVASSLAGRADSGRIAGLLYAVNTSGAIVGALAAGFLLIPYRGLQESLIAGAVVNVLIGVALLVLDRRTRAAPRALATEAARLPEAPEQESGPATERIRRVVLAVFAISGAVSLALEIVWFRVLVIFLRPTTYAFTMMLAAVLSGIALGSLVVSPLLRRQRDWVVWLAVLEIAIAAVALSSFLALGAAIEVTLRLPAALQASPTVAYLAPLTVASLLAIFPTALLLGAAFPVGLRLFTAGASGGAAAARTGRFYAANVCGAIAGALGAGFVLIPWFGVQHTLRLLAGLTLVSGLALLWTARRRRPAAAVALASIGCAACGLLAGWLPNPFDLARTRMQAGERLLWREEGVQTTVAIHQRGSQRIMYLDGHHQANDSRGTAFVHHRIGWLPTALHRDPRRALVVGLGGGATPGAVARFPGVEVDVVELSGAVVRGAAYFDRINFGLLHRPTTRIRVDDGRNYLLLSPPRQYDVVTADLILPNHAGAGSLYSTEYFRLVHRVLKPDGLALQWVGSGLESEYKLLVRTFLRVFPHATLWGDGSLLVAGKRPLTISRAAFEAKLADPDTRAVLESFGLGSFERLLGQYVAGPGELAAYVGDGEVLTDDRPSIEYFLSIRDRTTPANLDGLRGDVWRHVRD